MDSLTLARSFASLLLDTAAKGTALLLLAALAAWLCRRSSAALRHSIWCMTMGGLLLLPVASWALPAWQIPILPPKPVAAPAPVAEVVRLSPPLPNPAAPPATPPRVEPAPRFPAERSVIPSVQKTVKTVVSAPPVIEPLPNPAPASVEPPAPPLTAIEWTSLLVSAAWSLGVTLFGVLLLVGLWRTVQLRRASLTVHEGDWPGMLVELRQRLGLSRSVELREHAQSVVPLTWGIWRPVVLLPKLARAWDEPMRRAVLLHELAHVQRGDVACQVLGRLTCVLYWFHPLAWFALRQLRQEREQACDDAVVQSGEKASDYAEQLLEVARLCCAPRGLSLGVAMAEGSSLETRVKSLFDTARGHGPVSRRVAIVSVLVGIAILCGLAPIQPTASEAKPVEITPTFQKAFEATVDIQTEKEVPSKAPLGLGGPTTVHGMGSGMIIDARGYIVTAYHVIDGVKSIQVTLHDGTTYPASVVGQDPVHDLALLKVHPTQPLIVMPEQHLAPVKVTDEVTAIGNSFGWNHTVSRGIISGMGRVVELNENQKYTNLIQTDIALNPGSSGGPLLNTKGEAIGINIAIRAGAQRIGFAIPIQDARQVYAGLLGHASHINGPAALEQIAILKPVFGEAKRGIQLGVAFSSLHQRQYVIGERIPMELFFRNVSDKEVTFQTHPDFMAYPPSVRRDREGEIPITAFPSYYKFEHKAGQTRPSRAVLVGNKRGEPMTITAMLAYLMKPTYTVTLKPGEAYGVATGGLGLGKKPLAPSFADPVVGKYTIEYSEGIFWGAEEVSERWSESLTTGPLEFEIFKGDDGALEARTIATLAAVPADFAANLTPEPAPPQAPKAATEDQVIPGEYPFSQDLCRKAFSDPTTLQQLEQLKPVYGKAKRGIQLGFAINTLSRSFAKGERFPLMLVYRNVGQEELTFHISQDHWNDPPTVTDKDGHHVQVSFIMHWMFVAPLKITLKPGEAWCEMTPGLYLGDPMPSIKPVAGKYRLTHSQGIWDVNTTLQLRTDIPALPTTIPDTSLPKPGSPDEPASTPNTPVGQMVETPNWSENLATGTIEFEIAPGKSGQPEASILALVDGDQRHNADSLENAAGADSSQQVTGIVVDSQGRPVSEATVWCDVGQDKATRQPITARVETNAQGEFRFTVPKSSLEYGQGHFQHAAWAWKQGHGIGVGVAVASTRMPKNPDVRLSLPETSAVTLQVVDEKGQPLAGAEVSPKRVLASQVPGMPQDGPFSMVVLPPKELLGIATRKTDAEGRVTLDLVPRRYLRNVQVNSASHGEQSFSYYADVLKLNAVTSVEGELSNHQSGIRLSLRTAQTRPQTEKPGPQEIISADVQVVTDAQGKFSVPQFPVGPYEIDSEELKGPQFLKASSQKGVLVAGPVNKLSLDIVTGIPVKGRVVVRGEKLGVKNADVNVGTYSEFESGPVCTVYSKTDENGEYTSYTLPGHYTYPSLSSVGDDSTLIHPQFGGGPVSFQKPDINPADAQEVVLPEIAVDRGQNWLGKLVDEKDEPIDGVSIMPMLRGKQLFMPLPTQQGGIFGFMLLKGVTPDAWMVLTDVQDDSVPPLPTKIVSKSPLVLRTNRVAPPEPDPDQPSQGWSPYSLDRMMNNITAEEIEESQAVSSGFPELLKQAGLTEDEIASFNTEGPGEFSGIILDATTRQPIVGAEVSFMCLGPKSKITTNEKGLFRVQGLPPGMPAIATIKKEGYAPRGVVRQPGEQDWLILLDNQTCFEGVVTDAAGQPVADAIVRAAWESPVFGDEGGGMPMETETTSKADGAYRLPVPSSLPNGGGGNQWHNEGHEIQVVVPGRGSARKAENYIAYRSREPLSLKLTPSVRFEVQIVDSVTKEPVPGFVIYTTEKPFYMGRSDASGRLVIDNLLPGQMWFSTGEGEAITSSDCEGCEASVSYRHLQYSRWSTSDVRAGEVWSSLELHVPEGDKLQENFGSLRYDLKPDMPIGTLLVEKSATISGRVTNPDGQPVEGASVVCIRSGVPLRDYVKTDKDGRYVLYLPASKNAKYNLMVHDGEPEKWRTWANGVSAVIQTTPGQTVENFDLHLSRSGSVKGRVLRKGEPVANYTVRTVACDQLEDLYHVIHEVKTKADGTFEVPFVRPGKHFLQAGFMQRSKEDDQGPVIEVVAGETIADQFLEALKDPDPEEGVVPEPTPAVEAPAVIEKEPTDATSKAEPTSAGGGTHALPPASPIDAKP